jgi:hypothetical protein
MGIEPTAQAWEAWVLPLYDARLRPILVAILGAGKSGNQAGETPRPRALLSRADHAAARRS